MLISILVFSNILTLTSFDCQWLFYLFGRLRHGHYASWLGFDTSRLTGRSIRTLVFGQLLVLARGWGLLGYQKGPVHYRARRWCADHRRIYHPGHCRRDVGHWNKHYNSFISVLSHCKFKNFSLSRINDKLQQ